MPFSESAHRSSHAVTKLLLSSLSRAEQRVCNAMATPMAWVTQHGRQKCRLWKAGGIWIHTDGLFASLHHDGDSAEGVWNGKHFIRSNGMSSASHNDYPAVSALWIVEILKYICLPWTKQTSQVLWEAPVLLMLAVTLAIVSLWLSKQTVQSRVKPNWKFGTHFDFSTWGLPDIFLINLFSLC